MSNLLYTVAVILIIVWAVGFFAFSAGSMMHILLLIAIVSILVKVVQGDKIIHYQSHKTI
jgi:low affinity Fe/Cu permease